MLGYLFHAVVVSKGVSGAFLGQFVRVGLWGFERRDGGRDGDL